VTSHGVTAAWGYTNSAKQRPGGLCTMDTMLASDACCRLPYTRLSMDIADHYSHYFLATTDEVRCALPAKRQLGLRPQPRDVSAPRDFQIPPRLCVTNEPLSPLAFRGDGGEDLCCSRFALPASTGTFYSPLAAWLSLSLCRSFRDRRIGGVFGSCASVLRAGRSERLSVSAGGAGERGDPRENDEMARTAQRFISSQIYMMPHVHSSTICTHGEPTELTKRVASQPDTQTPRLTHEHIPTTYKVLSCSLEV
jgi:hypothetical protein